MALRLVFLFSLILCGRIYALRSHSVNGLHRTSLLPANYARAHLRIRSATRLSAVEDFDDCDNDDDSEDSKYIVRPPEEYTPSSMYEVNRKYRLLNRDLRRYQSPLAVGFTGVIISLDTVLTDLTKLFAYSFAQLAEDMEVDIPSVAAVRDLVGCTFRDYTIAFGWSVPPEEMADREMQFFLRVESALSKMTIEAQDGAAQLVHCLLAEGNDIAVVSSLPRPLALKVLGKSRISTVFENRLNPNRLLAYDPPPAPDDPTEDRDDDYGDRYMNRRFLRVCGLFKKSPVLIALIDGNRKHVLSARRSGMSCIAVSGMHAHFTHAVHEFCGNISTSIQFLM